MSIYLINLFFEFLQLYLIHKEINNYKNLLIKFSSFQINLIQQIMDSLESLDLSSVNLNWFALIYFICYLRSLISYFFNWTFICQSWSSLSFKDSYNFYSNIFFNSSFASLESLAFCSVIDFWLISDKVFKACLCFYWISFSALSRS